MANRNGTALIVALGLATVVGVAFWVRRPEQVARHRDAPEAVTKGKVTHDSNPINKRGPALVVASSQVPVVAEVDPAATPSPTPTADAFHAAVTELEVKHHQESRNAATEPVRTSVTAAFAHPSIRNLASLEQVDCRSTVCKCELIVNSPQVDREMWGKLFLDPGAQIDVNVGVTVADRAELPDGRVKQTVYFTLPESAPM
jgi:hypothetical protein